ncbi:MAG: multicopper oxidase family protein [Chloroflexota bacterium]|nr:MAG: multicopper oxidase family protein [Chloroflexota bacterium]
MAITGPSCDEDGSVRISRRGFLRASAAFSLSLATVGAGALLRECGQLTDDAPPFPVEGVPAGRASSLIDYASLDPRNPVNFASPLNLPRREGGLFGILDASSTPIDLVARRHEVELVPGRRIDAFVYQVESNGKTYLNPVLRANKGSLLSVRLVNSIGEETIVHWHGLHVDWRNDGHPIYAIRDDQSYSYSFTLQNPGAAYWYHPHPHPLTGRQTYLGLAGFVLVEDEETLDLGRQLDLELGVTDIPLAIQDKRFDDRGNLTYLSGPQEQFSGFLGDVVVVNMAINPALDVSTRLYRFRILNDSNARTYRLAFARGSEGMPFYLIGTDGGLLARPQQVREVFLSPAERVDVLLDMSALDEGDTVFLKSLAFDPMHGEMADMGEMQPEDEAGGMDDAQQDQTMGGMGQSRLREGEEFYLLRLAVRTRVAYDKAIPETLAGFVSIDTRSAGVRPFTLSSSTMQWLINGQRFEIDRTLFKVERNSTEVWEVTNDIVSMPHPMHLHGFQFQVLGRRNSPRQTQVLAIDEEMRLPTDLGRKDTVLVWPGETVRIAVDFSAAFPGDQTYLFHCHNLEHEDMGMMVNYQLI